MICYHGTSADNLESILKNGFSPVVKNWTCSEEDTTYFWSPESIADADCEVYEDDIENFHRQAFERASDSSLYQVGISKDCRRVVLAVNLTKKHEVAPDSSCDNMDGAVCVNGVVAPSNIRAVWIDKDDMSIIRGYFLSLREGMHLAVKLPLNVFEEKIVKAFRSLNALEFCEELSEANWRMQKIHSFGKTPLDDN